MIIYLILYKYLDTVLKFAVPAYMVAILTMSMMALNRKEAVNSNSFFLVFGGSLLFIISDTLLAINKFAEPIPFERLFVLGSYIAAQYLIMRGVIRQFLPVYVK